MLKYRWFNYLGISAVVILLDQFSKYLASIKLELFRSVELMPMLNFTLMHNEGAAFSFLSQAGGWQRWFFTVVALVVSTIIIVWLKRLQAYEKLQAVSLALVLGGAIGNVIDRILFGYVIDFIDVYYAAWHWPAFNIADSAISVGVVLLLIDSFRQHFAASKPESKADSSRANDA